MKSKTFPKLQIIFTFLVFFLQFCQKEETQTINKEQFIEIYARLLIINELKVDKKSHDQLLQELYAKNNVTAAEFDSTVSYYNSKPREWVAIYNRIREKIQNIKSEYQKESLKKSDSLHSKPKSIISTKSFKKSFINGDPKKKIRERQEQNKSEVKEKKESSQK